MSERSRPPAPKIAWVILVTVMGVLLLPLSMMLVTSLTNRTSDGSWEFTGKYWLEVFQDQRLGEALINSLIVAFSASSVAVVLGTLAALALAKTKFWGEGFLRMSSMMSLVFPEIVFALSLLSLFFVLQMQLSLVTVIIAHVSFALPYVILTVGARAASLDASLDDSARDLGASDWTLITKIHLPLLRPAIVSAFFLSFLLSFDDFLITFFVNGIGSDTLPIKLYSSIKTGITPKLNALATMIFLVTAITVFLAVRSANFRKTFAQLIEKSN